MRIHVDIDSGPAQRALAALRSKASNLTPALRSIGSSIVDEARLGFKSGTDPYGVRWKPLKPATIKARRKRSSEPLLDTGHLRNKVAFRPLGSSGVEIGTNVAYAAIHQFGGTINFAPRSIAVRLRKVKVTREDGTSYRATRFAKDKHKRAVTKWGTNAAGWSVTIPARPFIATRERGLPREYGEIIRDALAAHFRGVAT